MIGEFEFKQFVLAIRKALFESFPHLKGIIPQSKRNVRRNDMGMNLTIAPNAALFVNENNKFTLLSSVIEKDENLKKKFFVILKKEAKKRNICGFFSFSEEEKIFPIDEKARVIISWTKDVENLHLTFNGKIEIEHTCTEEPNIEFEVDFSKEEVSIVGFLLSRFETDKKIKLLQFSSTSDIRKYISKMDKEKREMEKAEKMLTDYLLSFSSLVKRNKAIPAYLNVVGNNEFIYFTKQFSLSLNKIIYTTRVQKEYLENEDINELYNQALLHWTNHINKNKLRYLLNVNKQS